MTLLRYSFVLLLAFRVFASSATDPVCGPLIALPEEIIQVGDTTQIARRSVPSAATMDLLLNTVWGSDGFQYRMLDTATYLQRSGPVELLQLESFASQTPLAVWALYPKYISLGSGPLVPTYYRSYLAVRGDLQGNGLGRELTKTGYGCMMSRMDQMQGFCYGYVEAQNSRSLAIARGNGSVEVAKINNVVFHHMNPQRRIAFRQATPADRPGILKLLNEQYAGYAFTDFDYSLDIGSYFLALDGDKPIAGIQRHRRHWSITHVPGGRTAQILALQVPRFIPYLRDRFNLRQNHFARLGNAFYPKDNPAVIGQLIESLLAHDDIHFGLFFAGDNSQLSTDLHGLPRSGLSKSLDSQSLIMARFPDPNDPRIETLRQTPALPSVVDN